MKIKTLWCHKWVQICQQKQIDNTPKHFVFLPKELTRVFLLSSYLSVG